MLEDQGDCKGTYLSQAGTLCDTQNNNNIICSGVKVSQIINPN